MSCLIPTFGTATSVPHPSSVPTNFFKAMSATWLAHSNIWLLSSFLKQRNLEGRDGNSIPQLDLFSESAWSFISAIFESGWDQLDTSEKSSFQEKVTSQLVKNKPPRPLPINYNSNSIKRQSLLVPPRNSSRA